MSNDAAGNVMATYNYKKESTYYTMTLEEQMIYGSSRLGMSKREKLLSTFTISGSVLTNEAPDDTVRFCGKKRYEFTNHLGNVLLVTTDRKMSQDVNTDGTTDHFHCVIDAYYDYGPFGNVLDGRKGGNGYRYGFNGQENQNELYGNNNATTAEYWMYDSRLGRRWNVDPEFEQMPDISPYATFADNPIVFDDPDGDCPLCVLVDYVYQVSSNLIGGDDWYDAFIGNIDVTSLLASGLPGGRFLRTAYKIIDAKVDWTANDGTTVKDNIDAAKEFLAGEASEKVMKNVEKFVKKSTSKRFRAKISKEVTNAENVEAKWKKRALKKKYLNKRQWKKFENAKQKAITAKAKKTLSDALYEASKRVTKAQEKVIQEGSKRILKDMVKPGVSDIVDGLTDFKTDTTGNGKSDTTSIPSKIHEEVKVNF